MQRSVWGHYVRALTHFEFDYQNTEGIVAIEKATINRKTGGWLYAIKVKVRPDKGQDLPQLYNGYNVIVEEVEK